MFGSAVSETAEVGTVCWNRLLVKRQLTGQTTSSSGLDAGEGLTMFFFIDGIFANSILIVRADQSSADDLGAANDKEGMERLPGAVADIEQAESPQCLEGSRCSAVGCTE